MSFRVFLRWVAVLMAALSACWSPPSTSPHDGTLVIGRVRHSISGGHDDTAAGDGNITVALKHAGGSAVVCSGVLLTPTVVATAAACLADSLAGQTPEVYFGSNLATAVKLSVIGAEAMPASASGSPGSVALIYLAPGNAVYEFGHMSYQTFGLPDWAGTPYEVAGWSPEGSSGQPRPGNADVRQYAILTDSGFFLQPSTQTTGEYRWIRSAQTLEVVDAGFDNARLAAADLGGPLMFQAEAGQTRQVIGILTQVNASASQIEGCASEPCDGWVALGPVDDGWDTPAVAWIKSKLATTHSPRWEAAHWRQPVHGDGEASWWRGEVDYYGPCRSERDFDCDHWLDYNEVLGCTGAPQHGCERDNCIHWPNTDQTDQDDDMAGDACVGTALGQVATYSPVFKAPACLYAGASCSSDALLNGRAQLGPEINTPNTIGSSCADGVAGTYHSDESIDRIQVVRWDGAALAPGALVWVLVDVWAYQDYNLDALDIYIAADARNPSWTHVKTLVPGQAGMNYWMGTSVLLPDGDLQAVRAVFRFNDSAQTCPSGAFTDVDDLVFATNNRACPAAQAWNGSACADVCLTSNGGCDWNATCGKTRNGRTCTCNPGYQGDGFTCVDVDECQDKTAACSEHADCANSVGSYTCTCQSGFTGDGIECIDKCLINNGGCSPYATCTNSLGALSCQCQPGYEGNGITCTAKPTPTPTPTPIPTPTPRPPSGCISGKRCCEFNGDGICTLCISQNMACP